MGNLENILTSWIHPSYEHDRRSSPHGCIALYLFIYQNTANDTSFKPWDQCYYQKPDTKTRQMEKRISTLICANPKTKSSGQCFRGKSNKARTDPKCPISARQHRTSNKSSDNHAWLGVPYGSFCPCIFSNCAWPTHKSLIPVVSDICNFSSNTETRKIAHLTVKRQQHIIQTKIWHSSSEEKQLFLQLFSIQPSGTESISWNARHSIE